MSYNYPTGPPGMYNRPPGYGGTPPVVPGAQGMAAPGAGPALPPGAPPVSAYGAPAAMGGRPNIPAGWPSGMPANMPNINFNAPVIRLGTSGQSRGGADGGRRDNGPPNARRGLGMDSGHDSGRRDQPAVLVPPTREEVARTAYVCSIPEGIGGDTGMVRILEAAGKLRSWQRCADANGKPQTFGFAEFEDAESLETAIAIFKDVRVPAKRQKPKSAKEAKQDGGDINMEDAEKEEEVETTQILFVFDQNSIKYAEDWSSRRNESEDQVQFRLQHAQEALARVIGTMFNPPSDHYLDGGDAAQDVQMHDQEGVEVAWVPLQGGGEDELADIPAEMRELVAAEIAAFRERSTRRDAERQRREDEIEAEERRRNKRSPPPASAPTGPGGANGVPLGPRADRGIQGAPSGPKNSQLPSDYQAGVNFVNGGTVNNGVYTKHEDEDDSASDSELERRRKAKKDQEQTRAYEIRAAKWAKQEQRSDASKNRVLQKEGDQEAKRQAARDAQARELKELDDDSEATRRKYLYFRDPSQWARERQRILEREMHEDARDRAEEEEKRAAQEKQKEVARGQADAFLDQQAKELLEPPSRQPKSFKISLGAAAKKIEQATASRRTAADIDKLLEDEEAGEQATTKKRTLIPLSVDTSIRANLTQEEIEDAQKQLARDIPNTKEGLWKWPVSWEHLSDKHIDKDIKGWAANKVLDTLGMQEDMLVDAIVEHLRSRGNPEDLVDNLSTALDEEAESLVKKLWRMVIYYSETEKRGIK
ncbi:hypothetical protein BS50DRAFT_572321 [Corynespora cassiicola Philippines]|uniref:PWI domain-containing protein n=1 Tax=Corynespora cassiicola Philippines TaxID=1448308 RepID=A0A2T2NUW8_CORCC|nr:hypothetical protein BS50DRAFT_572321 [Corynespora cassiicola Philippines]